MPRDSVIHLYIRLEIATMGRFNTERHYSPVTAHIWIQSPADLIEGLPIHLKMSRQGHDKIDIVVSNGDTWDGIRAPTRSPLCCSFELRGISLILRWLPGQLRIRVVEFRGGVQTGLIECYLLAHVSLSSWGVKPKYSWAQNLVLLAGKWSEVKIARHAQDGIQSIKGRCQN